MIFDAHSDIWTDVTMRRLAGETDVFRRCHLERLQKGDIEGSIFVIWVDPPFTADYTARTKDIMACVKAEIEACSDFRIVHTVEEIEKARQDGVFYVLIGIEGMAYVGDDLDRIDEYYAFGARHGMLTWNEVNSLGAGAATGSTEGLTPLGKQAVKRMQALGMQVDVSHLNEAGFWDIMDITEKPIIASHSNCKALCDVPRNLTDDQLRAIRDCRGVVGINATASFVDHEVEKRTVQRFAEHVAHMIDIMGIDHVGCGFDFYDFLGGGDAISSFADPNERQTPFGLADCSESKNLFDCFRAMGMTQEEMDKIAYGNFHRVLGETIG